MCACRRDMHDRVAHHPRLQRLRPLVDDSRHHKDGLEALPGRRREPVCDAVGECLTAVFFSSRYQLQAVCG